MSKVNLSITIAWPLWHASQTMFQCLLATCTICNNKCLMLYLLTSTHPGDIVQTFIMTAITTLWNSKGYSLVHTFVSIKIHKFKHVYIFLRPKINSTFNVTSGYVKRGINFGQPNVDSNITHVSWYSGTHLSSNITHVCWYASTWASKPLLYDSQNHGVTLLTVVLSAAAFLSLELVSDHQLHVHWDWIGSILYKHMMKHLIFAIITGKALSAYHTLRMILVITILLIQQYLYYNLLQ